jgi:hypothetical protein
MRFARWKSALLIVLCLASLLFVIGAASGTSLTGSNFEIDNPSAKPPPKTGFAQSALSPGRAQITSTELPDEIRNVGLPMQAGGWSLTWQASLFAFQTPTASITGSEVRRA